MTAPATITLTLHIEREMHDAILVRAPETDAAPVWLPVSQIHLSPERVGRRAMVTMPMWLARRKNLIAVADANQGRLL